MISSTNSVQFSCSVVSNSLQSHGLQNAWLLCPSPTPEAYSNSYPLNWWCHPTISSSVIPFSYLQSSPASGSFPMTQFFTSGGQSIQTETIIYPLMLVRLAIIKNSTIILVSMWRKWNPLKLLLETLIGAASIENSKEVPHETINKIIIWSSSSTPVYIHEENKNTTDTQMFTAAQLLWIHLKCYSTDEWLKKM